MDADRIEVPAGGRSQRSLPPILAEDPLACEPDAGCLAEVVTEHSASATGSRQRLDEVQRSETIRGLSLGRQLTVVGKRGG